MGRESRTSPSVTYRPFMPRLPSRPVTELYLCFLATPRFPNSESKCAVGKARGTWIRSVLGLNISLVSSSLGDIGQVTGSFGASKSFSHGCGG